MTTIRAFCVALVLAISSPAEAIVIPVGSTPADDLLFNFDFTSSTPAPPYLHVILTEFQSGGQLGQAETVDVFDDFNGTGSLVFSGTLVNASVGFFQKVFSEAGVLDGVFSVGFRVDSGAIDISYLDAQGVLSSGFGPAVFPTIGVHAVAEPSAFIPTAVTLAALFLLRGRRRIPMPSRP